jgi:peptidoglycan/xylan/chitin deacetylase (PgdA/CDA1 family)
MGAEHRMPMVLMYHSIEAYDTDPYQVTVDPRRFRAQLRWLRHRGLRGVSMIDLLAARRAGTARGLVGLTFDDGYDDFRTEVLPELRRHGWTASVYVVAGAMGGHNTWDTPGPRKALMTADRVREMADAGIEIGSHSLAHLRLNQVSDAVLTEQVERSREILSGLLGRDVPGFCYPYGAAGERETAAVAAAGYDYACSVDIPPAPGRHAIPRTFVGDLDTSPRLYAKALRHRFTKGRAVLAAEAVAS